MAILALVVYLTWSCMRSVLYYDSMSQQAPHRDSQNSTATRFAALSSVTNNFAIPAGCSQ